MAIAKMQKLNLVAMAYDTDSVLTALQRTGVVEVKVCEVERTQVIEGLESKFATLYERTEEAIKDLTEGIESYLKRNKEKREEVSKPLLSYSEFMSLGEKSGDMLELIERIEELSGIKIPTQNEIAKATKNLQNIEPYKSLNMPFSVFGDTRHTRGYLGIIPFRETTLASIYKFEEELGLVDFTVLSLDGAKQVVLVACHKSVDTKVQSFLTELSFTPCTFSGDSTGEELYAEQINKIEELESIIIKSEDDLYALRDRLTELKAFSDYLSYQLEKEEAQGMMRSTERTVVLQAYVPADCNQSVVQALENIEATTYYEFTEIEEGEEPPILMKNSSVVKNFEFVTNMYSTPSYREFDPNGVMAIFYSILLGFIVGDWGYGIVMMLGGGILYKLQKEQTGLKSLSGVFFFGGICAILWGLLFNSLFGIAILPNTIMPDPIEEMWSLMGISMPAVLILCFMIGIAHLCAGYVCAFWQAARLGKVLDGIFDGLTWAGFSIGAEFLILGLVEELGANPILLKIGVGLCVGCLLLAMVTAGRKEKLVGKFTKGFGAAYSIINFVSDILSYARLYGLLLSGVVIAGLVSDFALDFMSSGAFGIVAGVLLMVVGHTLNIAISLLGAYIHDSRLQYVEFYGRFFTGDGKLFAPLGGKQRYIKIKNN